MEERGKWKRKERSQMEENRRKCIIKGIIGDWGLNVSFLSEKEIFRFFIILWIWKICCMSSAVINFNGSEPTYFPNEIWTWRCENSGVRSWSIRSNEHLRKRKVLVIYMKKNFGQLSGEELSNGDPDMISRYSVLGKLELIIYK